MSSIGKLLYFLDRRDKLRALGLLSLMLLGAAFEAVGIAAILPFIALINDAGAVQQYSLLRILYQMTGSNSVRAFLLWCALALVALYLVKALFLALLTFLQYRFQADTQVALSRRLLTAYLHGPYTFHLQRNSAELQTVINSDIVLVFNNIVVSVGRLIVEALVLVAITVMLLIVQPVLALQVIGVLGGLGGLFYLAMRKRAEGYGRTQHHHFVEMTRWAEQALGGVKEAKLLGRETFFVDAYVRSGAEFARAMRLFRTVGEMPRLGIEVLMVIGLLSILVLMLVRELDLQRVVPALGLFAVSAVRLMPSLSRIVTGVTAVRFFKGSIDAVYCTLRQLEGVCPSGKPLDAPKQFQRAVGDPPAVEAIEVRNVTFRYPGAHIDALRDVSLTIQRGQSVAFVGPSGAGKSTLADVILGLLTPARGRVLVDGVDIHRNLAAWQRQIGYIPQSVYLLDDTIRRNVAFALPDEAIDDQRLWRALRAAQLDEFVAGLPDELATPVGERGVRLSGGQRQRIGIARALYHDPPVLMLDEATSAVDNQTESEILAAITQLSGDKTVITIAHRLTTVKRCDTLFFLKDGAIVAAAGYDVLLETHPEFRSMVMAASPPSA